ncbi:DUF4270 domain-containing protein [Aquimarina litoralis]|uniref:DUF4270 domain-containing protein n=1 Tax=Aquimarina litoralis TaxID=584605 RepID=UPI001C56E09B|nr:DUF4270 domain-containing protein [Aquimarina litoralis]
MNLKKVWIKITVMITVVITVVSCDDDFNSVGSEVIGDVNFEDNEYNATPVAYSQQFGRVQTSGLPNNLLGIYNDPVYGKSTYNIVAQVQPEGFNPDFGRNPVLDSVVLTIPYFSRLVETETNDDGEIVNTYELDSIYGSNEINISVYRSGYFLRDFDTTGDIEERQIYYSNDINDNFGATVEERLLFEINNFIPEPDEIRLLSEADESDDDADNGDSDGDTNGEPQVATSAPALRRALLSDAAADAANILNSDSDVLRTGNQEIINYFTEVFLDRDGSIELSNANNFFNYFRGLYFKVDSAPNDGVLMFFDITDADFTLYFTSETDEIDTDDEDGDGDTTEFKRGTADLAFNFSNNIVNGIVTDLNSSIQDELTNQDVENGEENLYLKGGQGAYAVIDLFNKYVEVDANGDFILDENENPIIIENPTEEEKVKTELDFLKSRDWLINEASMKLYINQDLVVSGETEPERIYIFNMDTGAVLFDYPLDPTLNTTSPILSATDHLGPIVRDSDQNGEFYKIKLTRYLINLLNEDAENVKLGLSVSQNVNVVVNAEGFTPTNNEDELIIPFSSIISHEGTILYGNGTNVPVEKRLKLDIFYTESTTN